MLTIFAIPKAFKGHFGLIQRNAIASWVRLNPRPDIILFGDDDGTREVAQEFGARYVAEIARNEFGTPLLSDMFEKAQDLATTDLVGYVNADIILMSDWIQAVEQVAKLNRRFLMVGQRWGVEVTAPIAFGITWEKDLREVVLKQGKKDGPFAIDYFVFPRGMLGSIPPFAIGRLRWDNWILYHVRSQGARLIDCTDVALVVHQNHDYSHHAKGYEGVYQGPEREQNLKLAGGARHQFDLDDVTHVLTPVGLKRALTYHYILRQIRAIGAFHPRLDLPIKFITKPMYMLEAAYKGVFIPKKGRV